jgi:hypothetical protein
LQARVRLRSGIIEDIHGCRAGRAHIGLEFLPGADRDVDRAIRFMASLGLYATSLDWPDESRQHVVEVVSVETGSLYERA